MAGTGRKHEDPLGRSGRAQRRSRWLVYRTAKIYNGIVINNTVLKAEPDDVIVHYIDYIKPWHIYYMDSDAKELYWQYVKKSLWSDLKPQDGNTVETVLLTARLLHNRGEYQKAASYYEAVLKYLLGDKYF